MLDAHSHEDQFERWGCENCPFLDMVSDRTRVLKCTSGSFDGYVISHPASLTGPPAW